MSVNAKDNTGFLVELSENLFTQFKNDLIELYLHAFTKGENAQLLSKREVAETLQYLHRKAIGLVYIVNNKPVGLLFWHSLALDQEFPAKEISEVDTLNCAYIAEVMVSDKFRGRGIATKMLNAVFDKASEKVIDIVIRVWDQNLLAILLYRKHGFKEIGSIVQNKRKSTGEPLEMRKLYMLRKTDRV